jgi:hypothetical protein
MMRSHSSSVSGGDRKPEKAVNILGMGKGWGRAGPESQGAGPGLLGFPCGLRRCGTVVMRGRLRGGAPGEGELEGGESNGLQVGRDLGVDLLRA